MGKQRTEAGARPLFRPDMLVIEALRAHGGARGVLEARGLPCFDCIVADSETLAEGCAPLGLEVDAVVAELNALVGEGKTE